MWKKEYTLTFKWEVPQELLEPRFIGYDHASCLRNVALAKAAAGLKLPTPTDLWEPGLFKVLKVEQSEDKRPLAILCVIA